MQVTNVRDHVTHAVIGPQKAEEFEIANSAEFFHVLSSTLYSDKPLAVVREVLCNAWDAHIEAGITDRPVEVDLTREKLVIRDFGPGIARDMIKEIYCTYGASTKTANGSVTGGFGLGSKSPWAYVDHFQVTSFCNGEKTIYNASKSSAMVNGKPSLMPLVSIPTDETGLEVSINLKDPYDIHKFESIIERIAKFGEMKVSLNGEVIETLPFEKAKQGFMILKDDYLQNSSRAIHIRYGNVVYPLDKQDEYDTQYEEIVEFLRSIEPRSDYHYYRYGNTNWCVILQADPNTISITPSRESLSMTDHTIQTITALLDKFIGHTKGKLIQECVKYTDEAIKDTWLISRPADLLLEKKFPNPKSLARYDLQNTITDLSEAGQHFLKAGGYPDDEQFRLKDLTMRLDALIASGFGNTKLLKSFRHHLTSATDTTTDYATRWLHKKLIAPLLTGLTAHKMLDPKRLHVYSKEASREWLDAKIMPATKMSLPKVEACLPYLRGVVIVAYTKMAVQDRVGQFPIIKHWMGNPVAGSFIYLVQRHPQKAEEALKFFNDRGFTVIDLTKAQPWEPKVIVDPIPKEKKEDSKPRPKGVPTLKSGIKGGYIGIEKLFAEDATRVEKPTYVYQCSSRRSQFPGLPGFSGTTAVYNVAHLFGHMIGIAPTPQTEEKLRKDGAKSMTDFLEWFLNGTLEEFQNNPLIEQYYRNRPYVAGDYKDNTHLDYNEEQVFNYVIRNDEYRKMFNIPPLNLPDHLERLIQIYQSFNHWDRRKYDQLRKIHELVVTWTEGPELKKLIKQIKDNRLVDCINITQITSILSKDSTAKPNQKEAARKMLLAVLKG